MIEKLKRLNWFFKERRKNYILGLGVLNFLNLIVILPPIIVGMAVDRIADGSLTYNQLFAYVFYMIACFTIEYSLGYVWSYQIFLNSIIIDLKLRVMMIKKILKMPRPFFEKFSSGDLMARASSDIDAISDMLGYGVLAFSDGIAYLGTIILAMGFTVSWKLTLASILPLPILTIASSYIGKYIHKLYTKQQEALSNMNDEVLEQINGVRVVRSYVLEKQSIKKFEETTNDVFKKTLKTEILASTFWPSTKLFTTISYAITITYGTNLVIAGDITLGNLISFNVYLGYLIWPMFAIGDFINIAQRGTTSIERVYEVLDTEDNVENTDNIKLNDDIEKVEFKNYSFQYPLSKNINLQDINLEIKKGQTIGIVGRTGSGKSTLIRQLLKEYQIGKGDLLINDIAINNIEKSSLMDKYGYISQDNVLFSKSVKENILVGKKDASDEEVDEAIKISDLTRDISLCAKGLDTIVGERGIAISGGQKQRISIARAIIKNPLILIMDDCLSAVDSRTEAKIIENIRQNRLGKTTIIATHRLSAVSNADEIIVLDNGVIIERGTHEELISRDTWYKQQYQIQQMKGENDEQ